MGGPVHTTSVPPSLPGHLLCSAGAGKGRVHSWRASRDFPRAEVWVRPQLRKMKVTSRWTGLTADCPFLTPQWEQGAIPCKAQGGQGWSLCTLACGQWDKPWLCQHTRQKAPSFSLSMVCAKHGRDEGRGSILTSPLVTSVSQCLWVTALRRARKD